MSIAKYYRAFRFRFPLMSAVRALYVARNAQPSADRVRFDFPDATEAERGALFRDTRPACVYWRPTEYSPRGHSIPEVCGAYNPRWSADIAHGYKHVRWIDKDSGLRLAGFADELAPGRSIDHTGWYADNDGGAFAQFRGIVYRLPHGRFAYGYADPHNKGCACLCFDNDADTAEEAARFADDFARILAEHEREYQAKETAAQRSEELRECIKSALAEAREIRDELREVRARVKRWPNATRPRALCAAVKAQLETIRATVKRYRGELADIKADFWEATPADYRY